MSRMRKGHANLAVISLLGGLVVLLGAVCCFAIPASASDIGKANLSIHLWRLDAAVADLDGDQIPDIAHGIPMGATSEGYSYQVHVNLSSDSQAKPFKVISGDSTGLKIESIDIDGDNDLDLLVSGRFSPKPIGVWLNDGRGRFTRGDLTKYVIPIWESNFDVRSNKTRPSIVLHLVRRPQLSSADERIKFRAVRLFFADADFAARNLKRIISSSARFRAPPVSSI
jgi:hypothetical protein